MNKWIKSQRFGIISELKFGEHGRIEISSDWNESFFGMCNNSKFKSNLYFRLIIIETKREKENRMQNKGTIGQKIFFSSDHH